MLSLLAKAEYPKAPLDLQLQVGWLVFLVFVLIVFWIWTRAESFRRAFFAREDPRVLAIWRIGLGIMTIQNFWNLLSHSRMLWTDEGMFTDAEVRQRLGRTALSGWTEVDGFLDGWAILKFFWGKNSLLFIHSSPDFVWGYLAVLFVALALFTVGFRTRITAVVIFLMINGIYNRNGVYLEGHDTVYRCIWLMTLVARTDAAWSVDNWLRRRREQKLRDGGGVGYDWRHFLDRAGHWLWAGAWGVAFCVIVEFTMVHVILVTLAGVLVSGVVGVFEAKGRGALHDAGKLKLPEPKRYQLVPRWPRYVIIAQLTCIYSATGMWKIGKVWKAGDALYYALNMDHFYRFEVFTQWVSFYFATNMFKVMSFVTLWWEKLFFLMFLGLVLKWGLDHKDDPWYQAQDSVLWRRWAGRLALIGSYFAMYRIAVIAVPWCLPLLKNKNPTPPEAALQNVHILFGGVLPVAIIVWLVLGRWPIRLPNPRRLLLWLRERKPKDAKKGEGKDGKQAETNEGETKNKADAPELEPFLIDQRFVRNWLFGRRIWLSLGLIFHGILFVFMNIGMFPLIMMWIYVVCFEAKTYLKIFRWTAELLRKWRVTAWMVPERLDEYIAEDDSVLETSADAVARDPAGPWYQDPHRLLLGPLKLFSKDAASFLESSRERGGRIPDLLVLALCGGLALLVGLRGLEARTEADVAAAKADPDADVDAAAAARDARKAESEARSKRIERIGDASWWWVYAVFGFAAVAHFRRRGPFDRQFSEEELAARAKAEGKAKAKVEGEAEEAVEPVEIATPPLVAGTLMRTAILGLTIWHVTAVGALFIPKYSVSQAWRGEVTKVYGNWVRGLNISQSWKMFSPNPPRSNTFMRTVVKDQDGELYMVGTDHYTDRPYVFWYNDRSRKMHRRMVGKSKWYLKYWSQYHCREWAFDHDGQLPLEVQVLKLKTPIPKPEALAKIGEPSDPRKRKLKRNVVNTYKCKDSNIEPWMKQRRGWELTEADERRLESAERKAERSAETTRRSWDARTDFGGEPRPGIEGKVDADPQKGKGKGKAEEDGGGEDGEDTPAKKPVNRRPPVPTRNR